MTGGTPSPGPKPALLDRLGRPLRDLRVSVTDRCNFRCLYCMPRDAFGRDHAFLERRELLSFEEIARVVSILAGGRTKGGGLAKVRLTGGEPLLRRDLESLVAMLSKVPDLDLTLTTNGALLDAARATALARAGLHRVTVSLDSLDDATFRIMSDSEVPVAQVLQAVDAAAQAGLCPVKVNAVVKRGVNDRDILPLAEHFRGSGHVLRFIEYMDVGTTNGWRTDDVVPASEILERIGSAWPLEPLGCGYPGEVAERWRYRDGAGEVGVIASVTRPFCRGCTRARLSADGKLFTCLFAAQGRDLKSLLRGGAADEDIERELQAAWMGREDRYSEIRSSATAGLPKAEMSYLGG